MERLVKHSNTHTMRTIATLFAMESLDRRSVLAGVAGLVLFFILGLASVEISRFGGTLATIWLPGATATAILLRLRLTNELPFLASLIPAIFLTNFSAGFPVAMAAVFAAANLIEVMFVIALIRRSCGRGLDVTQIDHLARFVWYGGLVGPCASVTVVAATMAFGDATFLSNAGRWLVTHALSMVLIVPTFLLLWDVARDRPMFSPKVVLHHAAVLIFGLTCAFLVFNQEAYPLLFLIPPITLLCAFRLGSVGTAVFVVAVAALTIIMTFDGMGPIAAMNAGMQERSHVLLAFIAANFLTGLPVAAILLARDRIVQELEAGRQELTLLTENTTDTLMYYDLSGKCTYVSPSAIDVMGEPPETFLGKRASNRMHKDAQERILRAENRLLSGASDKERFTYRRFLDSKHGTPIFLEAECAIAYDPETGEREGIVVSLRDVTERVELELLLTRARRKAEQAAGAKTDFLANMSHEIRTPMNGVLGFAELMLQTELDDNQRKNVELIVQSGRSMMMLLNDILDLSKIEAGQIAIDRQAVDLGSAIAECADLHRVTAEQRGLELVYESDADHPWVMTDGLRVRQILLNLIGNAVKFTEVGRITVTCRMDRDEIVIEVSDTGIGIPAERAKSIFEPFTQAESDTARRFGGTGLGLSISKQLSEMLGGYLEVESQVGVGSCFKLVLPFIKARPQIEMWDPDAQSTPSRISFTPGTKTTSDSAAIATANLPSGSRILLAEDHDVNRMLATDMLEKCGQDVYIAHDGNEAIAMVLDAFLRGDPYDLVLMDVQMPGCDGYEATRAIRGEGISGNQLPIIALTANAFPEDIAAARNSGMQAHLAKPMEFGSLARVLQRWLPTRIVEDHPAQIHKDNHVKNDNLDASEGEQKHGTDKPDQKSSAEMLAAEDAAAVRESTEIDARVRDAMRKQRERGASKFALPEERKLSVQTETQHKGVIEFSAKRGASNSLGHSPSLLQRWEERREEALQSVREGIALGSFDGEAGKTLKRRMHKLAGTAGIFGESDLGDKATTFERALNLGVDPERQMELAQELLAIAAEREEEQRLTGHA